MGTSENIDKLDTETQMLRFKLKSLHIYKDTAVIGNKTLVQLIRIVCLESFF